MDIKKIGTGSLRLMPPKPGTCPECGAIHAEFQPHNRDSVYYRVRFRQKHGRWPSYLDAMAHCPEDIQKLWKLEMSKQGIDLEEPAADE